MSRYTPSMLFSWLQDVTLRVHPGYQIPKMNGGIQLLGMGADALRPECLYIGDQSAVTRVVFDGRIPDAPICIISAGKCPSLETAHLPAHLWLLETELSLLPLYNRIQEQTQRFLDWEAGLKETIYTDAGPQELLKLAQTFLNATLILVNAGFELLAAVYSPEIRDPLSDEIQDSGCYSYATVQEVLRIDAMRGQKNQNLREFVSPESGNRIIIHRIRDHEDVIARLIVIFGGSESDPCQFELSGLIAADVAVCLRNSQGAVYGGNTAFGALISDLIEFRLTDPDALEQRIRNIELSVHRYFHVALISFQGNHGTDMIPWVHIFSQLKGIFPFSDITTYRGEILLLIRKTNRGAHLCFDHSALEKLLEQHSAYAAIGNYSEFLTSLAPMYLQTKSILRIGLTMVPEKRIFFYEDYSMYHLVEMADIGAQASLYSRNIVYLCHPGLISLLRYDKKTGSNLTEVLFIYLRCERNAGVAAIKLYIHRNTMLNKVYKIEEILGESLDDYRLRERLLFSYHVLEYMQKYRKDDILLLRRNKTADS